MPSRVKQRLRSVVDLDLEPQLAEFANEAHCGPGSVGAIEMVGAEVGIGHAFLSMK